jgi:hypothetical protein
VVIGGGELNTFIRSFDESPADGFLDLNTGRLASPPPKLVESFSGHEPSSQMAAWNDLVNNSKAYEPSPELLAWAEREGVNLIHIKMKASNSDKPFYAFRPLGMKVWRIDNSRFDHLEKELRQSKQLALPAPWEGPLAQIDAKSGMYDEKLTVSFLFITREGSCGTLQIRSPLGDGPYTDGGLYYNFIYENDAEKAPAR